jgi:VanZ family protein
MRREAVLRTVFWIALAVSLAMALNPHPPHMPPAFNDKLQHFALFTGLTILALAAYGQARLVPLGLALSGYGALIEILQMIPVLRRSSELIDWVADSVATAAVLALVALFQLWRAR